MNHPPRFLGAALLLALLPALSTSLNAANGSYTGGTGNWDDPLEWLDGIIAGATSGTTNTDTATMTSVGTITVDAYRNVQTIDFAFAGNNTVTGGTLYLTTGGKLLQSVGAGGSANSINSNIELLGDYTFENNTSQTMRFGSTGSPTINGAAGVNMTLTLAGSSLLTTNTISSVIADGSGGQVSILKSGTGIWTMQDVHTFTGTTRIDAGTLIYNSRTHLYQGNTADWSKLTVASGGILRVNATSFTTADLDLLLSMGTATTGLLDGARFGIDTAGTDLTYNTVVANTNSGANSIRLVKYGTGVLHLTQDNTFTGGTLITTNSGTLRISTDGGLGTGPVNIQTPNSGSSGITGTLQLSGDITPTFGLITIEGGGVGRSPANSQGHIENHSGNNVINSVVSSQASSTTIISNAGKLTFTGQITHGNNTGASTVDKPFTLAGAGDGEISGRLVSSSSGRKLTLIKTGSGTWILSNAGTGASRNSAVGGTGSYAGTTTVNEGTLLINTDHTLVTGVNTVNDTGTLGGNGILGGALVLNNGGRVAPGSGADMTLEGTSMTWNAGGEMAYVLGTNSSLLALTGDLTPGVDPGAFEFNFTQGAGFGEAEYTLLTFASSTFTGSEFTYTGLDPQYTGFFTKNDTSLTFTVVPEVGVSTGLLLGLTLVAFVRRRRFLV